MGTVESSLSNDGTASSSHASQDARRNQSPHPSSSNSPRRPLRRSRPPLPPLVTLNGLVLGLTGSGKRTLLHRLSGKDPFVNENETENAPQAITIPYQPPPNATVWDRIQLHVAIQPKDVPAVDFCVVLIHPRHDARNLRPYIAKILSMLMKQQQRQRPLCICFLINFRDLQGDRYPRISCQDVEGWAREVLQQDSRQEDVLLQCTTTSLKNCYGLSSLHHFIYQSYLRYKQVELQRQLEQVQTLLDKQKEEGIPPMTYESFLQVLKQAEATQHVQEDLSDRDAGSEEESAAANTERPGGSQQTKLQLDRRNDSDLDDGKKANGRQQVPKRPEPSRSILPKTYSNPKQSLDAFFADDDDDDDEEGIVTPVTSHHAAHQGKHHSSEEEDDDDEDDFYYDEGGHRHQHGGIVEDDSSSDDEKDQASVESLDSQIAHAREHSIIDSEESDIDEASQTAPITTVLPKRDDVAAESDADGENGDENGWDDDDEIDLSDSDDDHEKAALTEDTAATTSDIEHVEDKEQNNEVQAAEGWGDDDDLDLESDEELMAEDDPAPTNEKSPTSDDAESTSVDKHGQGDTETISKDSEVEDVDDLTPADPVESEVRNDGANKNQTPASPPSSPGADESTVDETSDSVPELVEPAKESRPTLTKATASHPPTRHDDSSGDDDDFIVEDTTTSTSASQQESELNEPQEAAVTETKPESPSTATSSSGISAAALAAIAAAEKEAQLMMQQQDETDPVLSRKMEKKKSKKKKDPEAKKKKKKHKEKRKETS